MQHYLVITTENGRQYPHKFAANTVITTDTDFVTIIEEDAAFWTKMHQIFDSKMFTLDSNITFSTKYVVSIQYQQIPDDAF